MRKDIRLSRAVHVLTHMACQTDLMTSADISKMLGTNAVLVRRMMGDLAAEGIVESKKGRTGGWCLAASPDQISLQQIHRIVSGAELFAIGWSDNHPGCLVEASVNQHIGSVLDAAEALITKRLTEVSLADILNSMDTEQFSAFFRDHHGG